MRYNPTSLLSAPGKRMRPKPAETVRDTQATTFVSKANLNSTKPKGPTSEEEVDSSGSSPAWLSIVLQITQSLVPVIEAVATQLVQSLGTCLQQSASNVPGMLSSCTCLNCLSTKTPTAGSPSKGVVINPGNGKNKKQIGVPGQNGNGSDEGYIPYPEPFQPSAGTKQAGESTNPDGTVSESYLKKKRRASSLISVPTDFDPTIGVKKWRRSFSAFTPITE